MFVPAAVFHLYCAYMRRARTRVQFPSLFKDMRLDKMQNKEILAQFLDINKAAPRYHRVGAKEREEKVERFKVHGYF